MVPNGEARYTGSILWELTVKTYLVGGAVRDQLLGLPVRDRDHVVVDATSAEMRDLGFSPVGKDFPIFLHPVTREEYALVRGGGSARAALEADLAARDLTINAMAMDEETGDLVDPLNGQQDLQDKLLRPAPGFTEDPIRLLRAARFAARFQSLGFRLSEELGDLMAAEVARGALNNVSSDRVWLELSKALTGPSPSVFLNTLQACGALAVLLPEVDALYGIPQNAQWHPEVDTGTHVEMVVDMAARLAPGQLDVAWAALTHDLGKALSDPAHLPKHHGHEKAGLTPLAAVHARLPVPAACMRLARLVCEFHLEAHTTYESKPGTLHKLFGKLDAYRRPETLDNFLLACEADKRGRLGMTESAYPQSVYLKSALQASAAVSARPWVEQGLTGERLATALEQARLRALAAYKQEQIALRQQAANPAPAEPTAAEPAVRTRSFRP